MWYQWYIWLMESGGFTYSSLRLTVYSLRLTIYSFRLTVYSLRLTVYSLRLTVVHKAEHATRTEAIYPTILSFTWEALDRSITSLCERCDRTTPVCVIGACFHHRPFPGNSFLSSHTCSTSVTSPKLLICIHFARIISHWYCAFIVQWCSSKSHTCIQRVRQQHQRQQVQHHLYYDGARPYCAFNCSDVHPNCPLTSK